MSSLYPHNIIDIYYPFKYFHVHFVCFLLFIFSAVVLHLKFAMHSISLTAHLEFEDWKHILSFVTSVTSTRRTLGEGGLQGRIQGKGPPNFFTKNYEAQRAEKNYFWTLGCPLISGSA